MKRNLKKMVCVIFMICLALAVTACGGADKAPSLKDEDETTVNNTLESIDTSMTAGELRICVVVNNIQKGMEDESYDEMKEALGSLPNVSESFRKVSDLCGDYSELSVLKTKVDYIISEMPSQDAEINDELISKLQKVKDAVGDAAEEKENVDKLFD